MRLYELPFFGRYMRIRSDMCIQPANGIYTIVFYSDLVDLHIYIFNIAPLEWCNHADSQWTKPETY